MSQNSGTLRRLRFCIRRIMPRSNRRTAPDVGWLLGEHFLYIFQEKTSKFSTRLPTVRRNLFTTKSRMKIERKRLITKWWTRCWGRSLSNNSMESAIQWFAIWIDSWTVRSSVEMWFWSRGLGNSMTSSVVMQRLNDTRKHDLNGATEHSLASEMEQLSFRPEITVVIPWPLSEDRTLWLQQYGYPQIGDPNRVQMTTYSNKGVIDTIVVDKHRLRRVNKCFALIKPILSICSTAAMTDANRTLSKEWRSP